jgi:hypothetical protein
MDEYVVHYKKPEYSTKWVTWDSSPSDKWFYGEDDRKQDKVIREIFDGFDGIMDEFSKGLIDELEVYERFDKLKNKYLR